MIKTFRHKGLRELFETGKTKLVRPDMRKKLALQLDLLAQASSPYDMNLPGYVLHEYTHAAKGTWSVKVTGNWRIIFRFDGADAVDVDLVDPHS
jgi:proteic killer suppression protein